MNDDQEERLQAVERTLGLRKENVTVSEPIKSHKVPFDPQNSRHITQLVGGYAPHDCQADSNDDCYICGIPSC